MIFYLYNIYKYLVFSTLRMKTKHSTTHGTTIKNKRMMSGGGKSKMSKITRRFKDHFKRFFKIDDNNKIKKCESWGSLNGIFKFLKADKETYKGSDGTQVSGIEKMKENINGTANSSNKDRYIKAIECFENEGDTILSGTVCVPYGDFVNGGGTTDVDAAAPPENVTSDNEQNEEKQVEQQDEEQKVEEQQDEEQQVEQKVEEQQVEQKVEEQQQDEEQQQQGKQQDEEQQVKPQEEEQQQVGEEQEEQQNEEQQQIGEEQEEEQQNEEQQQVKPQQVEPQQVEPQQVEQGLNDNNSDINNNNLVSPPVVDTTTGMGKVEPEKEKGGGGRSRRHTRPSRRVKSRKSKKGRMTRRKHRSSGRH